MAEYFRDVNEQDVFYLLTISFALSKQDLKYPPYDLTDPTPATTFAHLNTTIVLSRGLAAKATLGLDEFCEEDRLTVARA
ncbi:hypothetical protein R6Q57_003518 [Mikania cordata]